MTDLAPEYLDGNDDLEPLFWDLVDLWSWINTESVHPESDRRQAVRRIRDATDGLRRDLHLQNEIFLEEQKELERFQK